LARLELCEMSVSPKISLRWSARAVAAGAVAEAGGRGELGVEGLG
jgi:hypothetical protein